MDFTTFKYFWDPFNAKTTIIWELSLSWFKPQAQFSVCTANHKMTELAKEKPILYFTMAKQRMFFLTLFLFEQETLTKTSKNTGPKESITPRKIQLPSRISKESHENLHVSMLGDSVLGHFV